jgi:hypothetical protein
MRCSLTIIALLVIVFQSMAASTVSGIAVAAQWTGGNDNLYGGYGKIVKYALSNGVATASDLNAGPARFATISPDGQKVAFIKNNNAIAVMSVSGGAATEVVTGLPSSKGYLDWPAGDYVFYSKGGYGENGSKEVWKVNCSTKASSLVCTFNTQMWQWGIANDGNHACVRPCDGQDGGGTGDVYRYLLLSPTTISKGNADDIGMGCGNSISPDGAYLMRFDNYNHDHIAFHRWDRSVYKSVSMSTMNSWGVNLGSGMNRNRWSANDAKWICVMQGWDGRGAGAGSNQVLYNWIDGQQVRTSQSANGSQQQNEAGDFWIGTPSSVVAMALAPGKSRLQVRGYSMVMMSDRRRGPGAGIKGVWDLQGRGYSPDGSGGNAPAVGIIEATR